VSELLHINYIPLANYSISNATDTISLGRLDQFRSELQVLAQLVTVGANTLCNNQQDWLDEVLQALSKHFIDGLQSFNGVTMEMDEAQKLIQTLELRMSPHFQFKKQASRLNLQAASRAWIHFALTSIFAYVPDRSFDPALKHSTQRELLADKKSKVQTKLRAVELFEHSFSGQARNLRYAILEQELASMGVDIPELQIPRPSSSQLNSLQGELNIVLQIARSIQADYLLEDHVFDASVRQNITQMILRLRERYRAYDDLVVPLVGFLQCLVVGLTLTEISALVDETEHKHDVDALFQLRELQTGPPNVLRAAESLESSIYHLSKLAIIRSVESGRDSRFRFADDAHQIFAHLYSAWKDKLSSEQDDYAKKSSLYSYRGGQDQEEEVDEEEYNSLFPDYDNDDATSAAGNELKSPRDSAIRISIVHSQIFLCHSDPKRLITELLNQAGTLMQEKNAISLESAAASLPYIYFAIQNKLETLDSGTTSDQNYNIYTDPNVAEAKKLMALVTRIQSRFRSLLSLEFEHSTVDDVIRIGSEILAFQHTEPVAKFITKTEKLHEAMNEWERVASKAVSATGLYDELTSLIVSWRRLELTTWMRLYDLETSKCIDDAKSWWYVAYENIIAVPESLALAGQPLQLHALELVRTLEKFFVDTTMGQYEERLKLVMQFQQHVHYCMTDKPELTPVYTSLTNFIAYYSRFQQPISDALLKGRQKLERDVKEVVQLASWKDVNINALRQSARTSHQKLFKLVRKFRELLNRPVSSIIEQGPPDRSDSKRELPDDVLSLVVFSSSHQDAQDVCKANIEGWQNVASRFKNVATTVSLMQSMGNGSRTFGDGSDHIQEFLTELELDISVLQKETPSVLNDETKDTVKHLKTRKRKLFAHVLKKLQRMGFQYNLSTALLSKQDSTATILSSLPEVAHHDEFSSTKDAEYHFHKALSLMPQVRAIQREHSGDLTPAEVARSTGYLEGILERILQQRRQLASAVANFDQLESSFKQVQNLWNPDHQLLSANKHGIQEHSFIACRQTITWLVPVTKLFIDILYAQSKLGKFDAEYVTEALRVWTNKFESLSDESNNLPSLPVGIYSALHRDLITRSQQMFESFKLDIAAWTEKSPMLSPVLSQLIPWISPDTNQTNGKIHYSAKPISGTQDAIFASVDILLGSIQDLSQVSISLEGSEEEEVVGWLTKEDVSRRAALTSLHMKNATTSLLSSSGTFQHLPQEALPVAAALFSLILPILEQYLNICRHHLASYAGFHQSVCKLSHHLSTSFVQLGTKGFCTPPDKTSNADGQDDKLEGGTGLGEGEGAEDISKDIQDDEDLTELAQEPDTKTDRDEIEDEQDAVDMADAEMEGQMGDVPENGEDEEKDGSGDEDEGDEEVEEEAGAVDDLGPSTVDEKMWDDGDQDKANKDKENDKGKGSKEDEQVAAQDGKQEQGEEEDAAEQEQDAGAEEREDVGQERTEKMDEHVEQGDTLDLPDDMDIDGNQSEKSDDDSLGDLDDLEDGDTADGMQLDEDEANQSDAGDDNIDESGDTVDDLADELEDNVDEAADADEIDPTGDAEEDKQEDAETEGLLNAQNEEANAADDAIASETQGAGLDTDNQEEDQKASKSTAQQESGAKGKEDDDNQGTEGEQGANGQADNQEAVGRSEDLQDTAESQPFKKLGDTLEKWYNQQRQIQQPTQNSTAPEQERKRDVDMADVDFEHLLNEESQSEAQALGAASEDQARALDDDQAMATNETEMPQNSFEEDVEQGADRAEEDVEMESTERSSDRKIPDIPDGQANTFIGEQKPQSQRNRETDGQEASSEKDLEEVDEQLSSVHLTPSLQLSSVSNAHARSLWQQHELSTRTLAATLTEQLRLILAPTMATKLRGDFRTGKRLNIKRIIPYIASSYKRDKIWMRRSVPSKRAYQIVIALDDSKSMAEGGSKELAFETLALVAKALSMLESGELCVVGFGEDVKIAHPFDRPFTDDAGVEVLSQFTFEQRETDVKKLVSDGISLFQEARAKASGSTSELWQLMLVVSDAICDDADAIRRLVRKSQEEKIMIVFVVVDAGAREPSAAGGNGGADLGISGTRKGQSIMDLEKVEFKPDANGELKVVRHKYMADIFPFRWWIVVRDVRELPGVLATALRQWFAEVVEMA
jgi:midasin